VGGDCGVSLEASLEVEVEEGNFSEGELVVLACEVEGC
jgi:hypothetical protein